MRYDDLTGMRFGKLKVISKAGLHKGRAVRWLCKCDCGNTTDVIAGSLKAGRTKSCGKCIRASGEEAAFNTLLRTYKRGARDRNLSFELSATTFRVLTKENCHYCGSPPVKDKYTDKGSIPYVYSGIDRIDNSLGYVNGNVVSCCERCNRAKMGSSYDEFVKWISNIKSRK
jgi:hypothetical protein